MALSLVVIGTGAAQALTLGKLRAAPLLGHSLQLTVQVVASPGEDLSAACFDAEVFYGDNPQSSGRVNVAVDLGTDSKPASVSVRSSNPIDEPIVTVYLKAGCAATKVSRRYVLLADMASEVAAPLVVENILPLKSVSESKSATEVRSLPSVPTDVEVGVNVQKSVRAPRRTTSEASLATARTKPHTDTKSRLKVTPLDLSVAFDPSLRSSPALSSLPDDNPDKRRAAQALWKSLNAGPEEIMQAFIRLDAMEKSVRQIEANAKVDQDKLTRVLARLESAESARYNNPLVWGLLVALCGVGTVLVYVIVRGVRYRGGQAPWWKAREAVVTPQPEVVNPGPASPVPQGGAELGGGTSNRVENLWPPGPSGLVVDVLLDDAAFPAPLKSPAKDEVTTPISRASNHKDFGASLHAGLREINTEELLDVRQQAAFFMALGQHDQAVELLVHKIKDSTDSNPLVYLDLLDFLHKLGRKEDYEACRTEFNSIFSGKVPAFGDFGKEMQGLEHYPSVLERIIGTWPTPRAVDYLEECLVRTDTLGDKGFALGAFNELLMLHGVAMRLAHSGNSGFAPFSAVRDVKAVDVPIDDGASSGEAVDLDLSDTSAPSADLLAFDADSILGPASKR